MDRALMIRHLKTANAVAMRVAAKGHHPFGAILVAPNNRDVFLEQGNVDPVNHAESVLCREAATKWDQAFLWDCTLVTTVEPFVFWFCFFAF
jgi:tRNA(Arg) A34 adenosine deaminase TadA